MGERITFGGAYETENQDGDTVTRYKYWGEFSSSLMNRVNALSIQNDEKPSDILADIVTGDIDLDNDTNDDDDDDD